jgi:5-methylcytosine-specific restriction endonuclease McrA
MTNARELTSHLAALLRREHGAMADFLVTLADFDRRRLWVDLGHPSLFSFLRRELGLSAGAAQLRKTAAGLLQRFPDLEGPLRDGSLCLSTVCELSSVLTPGNRAQVLPRFFGLSKREAEALAVEIQPAAAPHREVVTAVRTSASAFHPDETKATPAQSEPTTPSSPAPLLFHPDETPSAPAAPGKGASRRIPPLPPQTAIVPLTADLRRLHVTVSRRILDKLEAARVALSHARPGATTEDVLEAALDLLLEKHAKRRGLVKKPHQAHRSAKPDRVPAHVKRAVWTRDGGRCQWPVDSGGVCGSTLRVEIDHVEPKARGGPPTVENLRLLCAFHNRLAARIAFGDVWMDRYARRPGRGARPPGAGPAPR